MVGFGVQRSRGLAAVSFLAAATTLLVFGPAAGGQTAGVTQVTLSTITGTLLVEAAPGVANAVQLNFLPETNEIQITDTAGVEIETVTAEQGNCRVLGASIACNAALLTANPDFPPIGVLTADGDDRVSATGSLAIGFVADTGDGADSVLGSPATDIINAGNGGDTVNSAGGADNLDGGDGNDTLKSGPASDLIGGGDGHDRQFGGGGRDTIWTMDKTRDPVIDCGRSGDPPAIIDRGLDAKPKSC